MKHISITLLIALSLFLTACDSVLDESDPTSVARSFWNAALSDNPKEAQLLMKSSSALSIGIKGKHSNDTAVLGEVNQQGGYYFIDTTLSLTREGKIVSIPLRTVVVPVNGKWRVDYWSTKQTVFDAAFDKSMSWFAKTLDGAGFYMDDILGAQDKEEAIEFAEQRLTEEFERAKVSILKNYKARIEKSENCLLYTSPSPRD